MFEGGGYGGGVEGARLFFDLRFSNENLFAGMTYALRLRHSPTVAVRFFRIRKKPLTARCGNSLSRKKEKNIRRIVEKSEENVEVVQVPVKGRGVAATGWFEVGDVVLRYCGTVMSARKGYKLERKLEKKKIADSFLFFFQSDSTHYCLDATEEDGSVGRLVNHSRLRPNCKALSFKLQGEEPVVALVAIRDIAPGEEILYDYGERRKKKLLQHPWLKDS